MTSKIGAAYTSCLAAVGYLCSAAALIKIKEYKAALDPLNKLRGRMGLQCVDEGGVGHYSSIILN